ncbi:MAG: TIGR04283 family arsenosugar biosynthesis glycosyltransferase [Candidatus Sumerlaeaceae bacterium]|nr:TIGR04283 family arsenosugar biosynthesis glycosyltransferase [Candidatus Sumerlaeaceae bacterium]
MPSRHRISIIIPARNEARTIESVLKSLSRQEMISEAQVIVVDGHSTDGTSEVAMGFPFVEVIRAAPGRSSQMNAGAAAADAPLLWFLHADSTLPERLCIEAILEASRDSSLVGGAFRFHLRGDDLYYRIVDLLVNVRSKYFRRPYGDQGIFVRTETFRQLGGFRDLKSCEDVDLVIRLRKVGSFRILPYVVETSARTWQNYGKGAITFYHLKEWLSFEMRRLFGPGFKSLPGPESVVNERSLGSTKGSVAEAKIPSSEAIQGAAQR